MQNIYFDKKTFMRTKTISCISLDHFCKNGSYICIDSG